MKIKIAIRFLLITVFFFSLTFLLASFYSTTFDITKWKEETRAFVSIMGGSISLLIAASIIAFETFDDTQNR